MENALKLLIVDNDSFALEGYELALEGEGAQLVTVNSGEEAVRLIQASPYGFDLVVLDYFLPGITGGETSRQIRACNHKLPIIIVSGYADSAKDQAPLDLEKVFKEVGADKFVRKGVGLGEIVTFVQDLRKQKFGKVTSVEDRAKKITSILGIVGTSQSLFEIADQVERYAPTPDTVLIRGESGSGKESIATALHLNSQRPNGPFRAINSSAIPRDLLESELFGHEKGAFTGATNKKPGEFLLANGGTIFLDEIGDMPADMQVKLLRVLQEREIKPVGATQPIKVDVRIVAATHQNLEELIERGKFREDLYYRLRDLVISVPPLRERLEDIPIIAQGLLDKLNERSNTKKTLSARGLQKLKAHVWPGNVRELQSVIKTAYMESDRVLQPTDITKAIERNITERMDSVRLSGKILTSDQLERKHREEERQNLLAALSIAGDNKELAAKLLGFKHSSLFKYRLKKTGILPDLKWGDVPSEELAPEAQAL